MNTNAIAAALIKAHTEFGAVKRNKSRTVNGNAYRAIVNRARTALREAGEDRVTAASLVYDVSRKALPEVRIWN